MNRMPLKLVSAVFVLKPEGSPWVVIPLIVTLDQVRSIRNLADYREKVHEHIRHHVSLSPGLLRLLDRAIKFELLVAEDDGPLSFYAKNEYGDPAVVPPCDLSALGPGAIWH